MKYPPKKPETTNAITLPIIIADITRINIFEFLNDRCFLSSTLVSDFNLAGTIDGRSSYLVFGALYLDRSVGETRIILPEASNILIGFCLNVFSSGKLIIEL